MRTRERLDNWLVRMTQLACAGCLISLAACASAQTVNPESFIGRSFWYQPLHDKYVPTEFYNSPELNAPTTRIQRKTRVLVVNANKSWFAIRAEPVPGNVTQVFMPASMFLSRLYRARDGIDANAAFMRASLFAEDPDIIKLQFENTDPDPARTPALKPSTKLKPWQKYKENWGSITPAPKKNKHLLLDEIKQTEEPVTPP